MTPEISAKLDELRAHPIHGQLAAWALEARATCEVEGHPRFIDGRCIRCRTYEMKGGPTPDLDDHLPIRQRVPCPHYTVDQGCPLHGELCAEGIEVPA